MSALLLYILRYLPCLKIYVSGLIFHSFAVLKPKPAFSQIALVWHKKKELEEDGGCTGAPGRVIGSQIRRQLPPTAALH